jgi:hypothetical protein
LPRFSALRRIPAQARWLKKNLAGTLPVSSTSRNEEDTPPPLGNSEEASVKHSPSEPVPEFRQAPEEGSKRPSSVSRQDSGHVLPDDPLRLEARSQLEIDEGELSPWVVESLAESCDAEGLAGASSDQNVN